MARNRKIKLTSGPSAKGQVVFNPLSSDANPTIGVAVQGPDSVGVTPLVITLPASVVNNGVIKTDASAHLTSSLVVDANIDPAAAIAVTKIAAQTPNRALATDSSGIQTPSSTTDTELSYVSGVTSAIQTQLNGKQSTLTLPLSIAQGGTGQTAANAAFNALSPMTTGGDLIYGGASGVATRLPNGSATQVLTSNGTTLAPSWQNAAGSPTGKYWQGYFSNANTWSIGSPALADPVLTSGSTILTTRGGTISVSAASSNRAGITFTPASAAAIYLVTFSALVYQSSGATNLSITDGSTVVAQRDVQGAGGNLLPVSVTGIYIPGTASPVTLKIQTATSSGTAYLYSTATISPSIEITVVQIA